MLTESVLDQPKAERAFYLLFSDKLSALTRTKEFSDLLHTDLKTFFGFNYSTIFLLDEAGETFEDILHSPQLNKELSPFSPFLLAGVHSDITPLIIDCYDLSEAKKIVSFLNTKFQHRCREAVIIKLYKGENLIGNWIILNEEKKHYTCSQIMHLQLMAKLLTVSVLKVLSNEQVEKQIQEINSYKVQLQDEALPVLTAKTPLTNNYGDIIGGSQGLKKTFQLIEQVAAFDSTVLILGETGTGKELIARAIHNNSPRKLKPMIKVNCATFPPNLIESELFGHERGSFTGATERRLGKFELANHGTLFLDEVGEMPLDLQVKLLRVLQEKEIERVGGRTTIKVDIRIVAATNRDLAKEMEAGRFRSDLYYRLNIFPIHMPPLRDRLDDIAMLATHFVQRFAGKMNKDVTSISNKALKELLNYHWPGNIRELEHLIERHVLMTTGNVIKHIEIPPVSTSDLPMLSRQEFIPETSDENERNHIYATLTYCRYKVSGAGGAADLLGIPPSTLNSKIKRLGIERKFSKP